MAPLDDVYIVAYRASACKAADGGTEGSVSLDRRLAPKCPQHQEYVGEDGHGRWY